MHAKKMMGWRREALYPSSFELCNWPLGISWLSKRKRKKKMVVIVGSFFNHDQTLHARVSNWLDDRSTTTAISYNCLPP